MKVGISDCKKTLLKEILGSSDDTQIPCMVFADIANKKETQNQSIIGNDCRNCSTKKEIH